MRGGWTGLGWLHSTLLVILCRHCVCEDNTTATPSSTPATATNTSLSNVRCRTPGELVPNTENCRKYYKCSNGEPSLQSCPGTLIFDPVLKICNWPDSTTCISDLLVRPRTGADPGSSQFSKDILHALRAAATETPVIVNITPANKLSKRILSLFQSKQRKSFNKRIRTNNFNNGDKLSQRPRTSSFTSRNRESDSYSEAAPPSPTAAPAPAHTTSRRRNPYQAASTTTTATRATPVTTESPRVRIRPFSLRKRPSPLRSRSESEQRTEAVTMQSVFRQLPGASAKLAEAEEDVVTKVRSESSVSSVSSYVRVSVGDLASLQSDERPFSNGRGGDQFDRDEAASGAEEEDDYLSRLRQELELSSVPESASAASPATTPKPKAKTIKCHTGASNELYANPRNCRKYYKCQNGEPSLQSCPANLIFDTSLKICNWPTASICVEDPEAPLPKHVTSDRELVAPLAASQDINAINIDSIDSAAPGPPHPEHATVPSLLEAAQREAGLKAEHPQFARLKETVRTLDTKLVERVAPGSKDNPDNVKRVEFILSEDNYEDLFPRRHPSYTYRRLLQAIAKFPAICAYVGREEASDAVCRRTLATMFAHFTQETGAHNPSDKEYEEWRQGLHVVREQGCTDTSPGCGYNDNCEDTDSITRKWACGRDAVSDKWRKYYGRGAKQLSYNFNYGQFSQAMFGEGRLLLDHPDFVADTWLNLASATWFLATPQPPKPSMLHVIDGTWQPNAQDQLDGIRPGFGATINIINGGVECNTRDGRESRQARTRAEYYKQFAWYLYVDYEQEELGCANQKQFSAGGAGAVPIYWDKDWSRPYSCKLVNYQTAHSALVSGEYVDCVEENFGVTIR